MTPERKYVLTKVAPGDYLLPSNDARTIWRIARYTDGPSSGLDLPRDREFWGLWRWAKWGEPRPTEDPVDLDDWDRWEQWGSGFETRAAAIVAALD